MFTTNETILFLPISIRCNSKLLINNDFIFNNCLTAPYKPKTVTGLLNHLPDNLLHVDIGYLLFTDFLLAHKLKH